MVKKAKSIGVMKRILSRVEATQAELQDLLKKKAWIKEARKYSDQLSEDVKHRISCMMQEVKKLLDRTRKELKLLQKLYLKELQSFAVRGRKKPVKKSRTTAKRRSKSK